jgi:hypothetical protein
MTQPTEGAVPLAEENPLLLQWELPRDGGDITFHPGSGFPADPENDLPAGRPGNIRFKDAEGNDMLCLHGDGRCTVRGEVVDTDDNKAVFTAFADWLRHAGIWPEVGTELTVTHAEDGSTSIDGEAG